VYSSAISYPLGYQSVSVHYQGPTSIPRPHQLPPLTGLPPCPAICFSYITPHLFLLALFDPEDKSTTILQNGRNFLSNSTAAHHIRLGSSTTYLPTMLKMVTTLVWVQCLAGLF